MAITPMQKVLIAAHLSQAGHVISALQNAHIIQILDAERAMISKEWPDLEMDVKRPKDIEELVGRLNKAIAFLKEHSDGKDGRSILRPLVEIDKKTYTQVVLGSQALILLDKTERLAAGIEKVKGQIEMLGQEISRLLPWQELQANLEQLNQLETTAVFAGILPKQHLGAAIEKLTELQAAIQYVGGDGAAQPCLIFCIKESAQEIQKAMRVFEFDAVNFEGLQGTIADLLPVRQTTLADKENELKGLVTAVKTLATEKLKLEILADHYLNYLIRRQTQAAAPGTETTLFLEGWVKQKDYPNLTKIIDSFDAASVAAIDPAKDEQAPIEIDNGPVSRPFETITRLYGMPSLKDVDPTVFLSPFFALFFGLCMSDAGYGIVMVGVLWWVLKTLQGDKKIVWMLMICSVMTIIAGILTGSWFADTIPALFSQEPGSPGAKLNQFRRQWMLFDPMEKPQYFIILSLVLGYIQMMCGLTIAFFNLLRIKDYAAALFDKLVWLVYLNCIIAFIASKGGALPPLVGTITGYSAIGLAILILIFTDRTSGIAGRLGNGGFAVFSTLFWVGDSLSYVRLMALCLVGAGLGMAINILTKIMMDVPYIGWFLGMLFFVVGHTINILMSMLSSFVHTLRLQFVEYFPKFFVGGGTEFKPLGNEFHHIMVVDKTKT